MLAEQGKLALDDLITYFLPGYPTRDHKITVRHLLSNTSGIKNYTDMPDWSPVWRKDFTVQEMIDFFKHQPMQFTPGDRWGYSNSGYFLLGAIIEKVSGQTYEQFIQENIFARLKMTNSYYDNPRRVIQRRVAGYDKSPDGYINADYLSMTHPHAAGALASTVDDLAIWDSALYTEQLLKLDTLQQAFTPNQLADGSLTAYGFGWAISEYEGHPFAEHGGGIHGFRSYAIRLPRDRVFVAVLSNNGEADPELLAFKIAALVIGKPYKEPVSIELDADVFARYEGIYEANSSVETYISRKDNLLFARRGQGPPMELIALAPNEFCIKGRPFIRLRFLIDAKGATSSVETRGRAGIPELATKTS